MRVDAKKLRLAMARKCMESSDLSEACSLSIGTIYNVLTGRPCNLSTIGKIAKALGVDVTEILED